MRGRGWLLWWLLVLAAYCAWRGHDGGRLMIAKPRLEWVPVVPEQRDVWPLGPFR